METTLVLDPFLVALIGGTIIPILTGLITKLEAGDGIKSAAAFVLSILVGVGGQIVTNNGALDWKIAALAVGAAFATNVTTYLGLHTTIGKPAPFLATETANFGLGQPSGM